MGGEGVSALRGCCFPGARTQQPPPLLSNDDRRAKQGRGSLNLIWCLTASDTINFQICIKVRSHAPQQLSFAVKLFQQLPRRTWFDNFLKYFASHQNRVSKYLIFYHHVTFDIVSWPVWAGERVKEKFRLILFRHKTRLPDPNCSVGTRVLNCAPTRGDRWGIFWQQFQKLTKLTKTEVLRNSKIVPMRLRIGRSPN